MKHFKKTVGIISAAALALALVPITALVANADTAVNYYGKTADGSVDSGTVTDYSLITSADTQWGTDGETKWYVADSDLTIDEKVEVYGNVNIIVKDGVNFIINGGIEGSTAQVTVYSETEAGTGIIAVTGADGYTGNDGATCSGADNVNGKVGEDGLVAVDCGKFIVSGGIVTVVGGKGGDGGRAGYDIDYETSNRVLGAGGSGGNGADAFTATTEIYLFGGTLNVRGGKGGSPANDYNSSTSSGTPGESGRALHGIYAVNGTLNALSNSEDGTDDKADYFLLPIYIPEGSELTLKGNGIAKVDNGTEITSYGNLTLDTVLDVKDGGAIYTNGSITASIPNAVVKNNTGIVRRITPDVGEGWSVDQTNKRLNIDANYKMVSTDGTNTYTSTVSGAQVVQENNLLGVIRLGDGAYIDDSASCPNELPYYVDIDCGTYAEQLSGNCFVYDSESQTYTFNNLAMGTLRFADTAIITDSNGTAISTDKYTYDSSNGTIGLISVTENIKIVANLESCDFDIVVTDNEGTTASSVNFIDDYDTGSSTQTKTLKVKVTGDGTVTNCRVVKESDFDKTTGTVGTDTSVFKISYIVNPNNADGFEVTDTGIEKILSGESGSFIIAPKDNLAAGTYEETFLVYSDNSTFTPEKYVARFTVKYVINHDSDGEYYYDNNTEHYSKCVNCSAHVDIEAHTFDKETVSDSTFAKEADCTNPAKYYYSCVCGAHSDKMTETFEDGEPNGHSFGNWTVVTAATCTEGGQDKRICSVCQYKEFRDTNPLGHDWEEDFTVDLEPTCTQKGSKSIHCSRCSATKDVTDIDANGHSFGNWTEVTAPTCTAGGQDKRICSVCKHEEFRDTNPLGHAWDEDYTIDLQPTCTEKGSKSIHCSRCSATKDVTDIDANGHSFGNWTEVTAATCTAGGQDKRICSVCQHEEFRDTNPLGHDWDEDYTIDLQPTCTEKGSKSIHCSRCSATKDATDIDANGHSFGNWTEVTAPTCTVGGQDKRICSVCQHEEFRDTDPLGHAWDEDYTIDLQPTCTEKGSKSIHCSRCSAKKDVTDIDANGHSYGEWTESTASTCTESGKEKRICSVCQHEEFRDTNPLGHAWDEDYTIDLQPTCTEKGSKSIHCSRCSATKDVTDIDANGHSFGNWTESTASTCTEGGQDKRICSVCKHEEFRDTNPLGHDWDEDYTIDLEPTCTEKGSKSIHCSRCSATKDVTDIDANGHSYGEWTESTASTCTESGKEKRICSVCQHEEFRDTNPLGHAWEEDFTVDSEPTCTEKGSKSIHCSRCSATKDVTDIDANGHSFGEWTLYSTAGCSDKGQEKRTCSVCGYEEYRDTDFDPDNHTWEDHYTVDKEPTCTTEGSESIHCAKCGATKDSRVIPVIDHIRGEWETDTEATCTTEGSESVHCTMCGILLDTRTIPVIDHIRGEWETDTEATCTTEGSESVHCTMCGILLDTRTIPVAAHDMGEWETVSDPTCFENGKEKRICKDCGSEEYRDIDHAHIWEDDYTVDKEPDCENDGSKSIHCSRCDAVKDEETIPAIGHEWGEWTMVKEPTETEDGEEQRTCKNCEKTESRTIKSNGFWTHDDKGHWHEDEDGNRYYYSDHEFIWVEDESGRGHYQCISCAYIKYEDDKSNPDTGVPSVAIFVATALIAGGTIPVLRKVKSGKKNK